WWVGQSTGKSLATSLWSTWAPTESWVSVLRSDFNGDGRADIAGRTLEGGERPVGTCAGTPRRASRCTAWDPSPTSRRAPAPGVISGYIAPSAIGSLPNLLHFAAVTPVYRAQFETGAVDTQGDQVLQAVAYRNSTGVDGTGSTVGVISDSVNRFMGGLADSR